MRQILLTESQFNTLMETHIIVESIFEIESIAEFKSEIKKLIKRMLLTGISIGAIYTMINNYCCVHNVPEDTKQEVIALIEELPDTTQPFNKHDWKLADTKTLATVYNAVPAQCNDDCSHTASMFRLNLQDVASHRIIAMERTFMKKLGLRYNDVVYIEGTDGYDGVWQIQDTMNKRYAGTHKIDILVPKHIRHGLWNNVKLYVLKDKSLTDKYRSDMSPQLSKEDSKKQTEKINQTA